MMRALEAAPADPPVRITREIPLWGLVTAACAFALQSVGLYYSNQALAAAVAQQSVQLLTVAADVRTITVDINKNAILQAQNSYRLDELTRRVTAAEYLLAQKK